MLEDFFSPGSIAVVGASREPGKVGYAILANILAGGFKGPVYPVNPSAPEVQGLKAYRSVSTLPGSVDLAVIAVPPKAAVGVIGECAALHVPAAIVISAGFRETGPAGAALERELVAEAAKGGVRLLGPNSLGIISTPTALNASFAEGMPLPGNIAFLSQSGALGAAILDWAHGERIGFSYFASVGNKADVGEVDLINAWSAHEGTSVVVGYLEAVSNGRGFVDAVSKLTRKKPFIAITAGSSDAGARAVSSHTGSLAGSDAAYGAAFRKAGAIRAHTVQDLFDFAEGFSLQPLPAGPGTMILTNAGGPAILASDACAEFGLTLAVPSAATVDALRAVLPPAAAVYNPVDILGDAPASRYADALRIVLADPATRSLVAILSPQAMTEAEATAGVLADAAAVAGVPVAAVFMGDESVAAGVRVLKDRGIPTYAFPERAVAALAAMQRYRSYLDTPASAPCDVSLDRPVITRALEHARAAGRTFITEMSAQAIAEACGIPVPKARLVHDVSGAVQAAEEFGYPAVLKVASPDILHKSDLGGIALDLASADGVRQAYDGLLSRVLRRMPDARVWGVTVQEQISAGREVIVGVNRDPNFGPILMFGLGGIYVEVMKDVSFRLCPVTPADAREMIAEIRGAAVLRGTRGMPPADIDAVVDVICRTSALVMEFDAITELDINPLIVGDRGAGALAADIRIGIGE